MGDEWKWKLKGATCGGELNEEVDEDDGDEPSSESERLRLSIMAMEGRMIQCDTTHSGEIPVTPI
jgi:hypothetical protein